MTTLTTQMNGYYDMVPRAVTAIAMTFPLDLGAGDHVGLRGARVTRCSG